MKTHEELRQMAAELEARKLRDAGEDVVVGQKRDPNSPTPRRTIPVILRQSDIDDYEREKGEARATGAPPPPPPVPILSFDAWTYKPRCPSCFAAQVAVDAVGGEVSATSPARCTRPIIGNANRDCGWKGENRDLLRPCLICGGNKKAVEDGACKACAKTLATKEGVKGG